jgi:hypothetical protein
MSNDIANRLAGLIEKFQEGCLGALKQMQTGESDIMKN